MTKLDVEIVLPVLNERAVLAASVTALVEYLEQFSKFSWQVTIVDNGSDDDTYQIATQLCLTMHDRVKAVQLSTKGRGRALRYAWSRSSAEVLAYMDIDLSTNLKHFLPLVEPLLNRSFSIAVGNRLANDSRVVRKPLREVISRIYNLTIRMFFPKRKFRDAQCGFKALRRDAALQLLPLIEDNSWFFDTELLIRAEQSGYEIVQIPVEWVEDPDSRVKIIPTAIADVCGLLRVRREPLAAALRRHSNS